MSKIYENSLFAVRSSLNENGLQKPKYRYSKYLKYLNKNQNLQ